MKIWRKVLIGLIGVLLVGGATYFFFRPYNHASDSGNISGISVPNSNSGKSSVSSSSGANGSVNPNKIQPVTHIFIIMDENQPASLITGNSPNDPYLSGLIKQYSLATNYFGVTHPSLPNYLAITSGSTDNTTTDCNPPSAGCIVNVKNIADTVQASGRTWKEYAESMPSNCYAYNYGNYATKHNPFVYYADIINNKARCAANVVPFSQLQGNLSSVKTTPDFAFITPNLCNDMHNCSINTGDYWLSQVVPMILHSPAFTTQRSLLFITWDEGDATNNNVATIVAGSAAKQGYTSNMFFDHYSILSTIESLWNLPPLTQNDKSATPMLDFIKPTGN
jgi:hypothetical protein